jgi:hypothetical protein
MPFKDAAYRKLKAREYTATYRKKVSLAQKAETQPRFCMFCFTDISNKRADAKFCSRNHKQMFSDQNRDYAAEYDKNREHRRAKALEYYYSDIEKSRRNLRLRQQRSKPLYAALAAKRRAAKLLRTPTWLTPVDFFAISNLYAAAAQRTAETGVKWHVDHIVPLQGQFVSGLHVPWNLQLLPATDNISKHNRYEAA